MGVMSRMFSGIPIESPIDKTDLKAGWQVTFNDVRTGNRYAISQKLWDVQKSKIAPVLIPKSGGLYLVDNLIFPNRKIAEQYIGLRPSDPKTEPITDILPLEEQLKEVEIDKIRPRIFDDFIGQNELKQRIQDSINASLITGQSLPHMLFSSGLGGVGKTSMAYLIAKQLGVQVISATGNSLTDIRVLYNTFKKLNPIRGRGDIIFCDEIHSLRKSQTDDFLRVLEDNVLYIPDGKNNIKELILPSFTLIGSTTRISDLPNPFISRMRIFKFQPYNIDDIKEIIYRLQPKLGIQINHEAKYYLAEKVKCNPRNAVDIFKECKEFCILHDKEMIDLEVAKAICKRRGIYALGLNLDDIKVLKALSQNQYLSAHSLATLIGESTKNYEINIESYLFEQGMLDIRPRGRCIMETGKQYLKSLEKEEVENG